MREQDYIMDNYDPEFLEEEGLSRGPGRKSSRKARRMMQARRAIEDHFERKQLEQNVNDVWLDED